MLFWLISFNSTNAITNIFKATIVSLYKYIGGLKASLQQLQNNDTIGGWADRLKTDIILDEENVFLKDIELISNNVTRSVGKRNLGEIRSGMINQTMNIIVD